MKFDSSSWYVKAGLLRFCGDHVRVFFFANYTFCTLASEVPSQNTEINRVHGWYKNSFFTSALRALLTRNRWNPGYTSKFAKINKQNNLSMIAFRRAILMKADPVVHLHANRLFSGRACSCKKDPCPTKLQNTKHPNNS